MHIRTYIHTLQGETLEYNLMWYFAVQRACGALSKLVHVFNGNTANRSSSTKRPFEVVSKKSGGLDPPRGAQLGLRVSRIPHRRQVWSSFRPAGSPAADRGRFRPHMLRVQLRGLKSKTSAS